MQLLAINTGSTSVKLDQFLVGTEGSIRHGRSRHLGPEEEPTAALADFAAHDGEVDAVAHRVVHGGSELMEPIAITDEVAEKISNLSRLAPLHNPRAYRWIEAARQQFSSATHVAVFDTAFFADLPSHAARYALPRELADRHGIRRYGFHGLAHRALWQRWQSEGDSSLGDARAITLQLGGGASAAAIRRGRPLDTSMGFSPAEGLVMATRSGDIDPGILTYLQREASYTPEEIDELINRKSGLLGVSERSGDLQELLRSNDPKSQEAVAIYCYHLQKYIGSYLAVLEGVDAIIFGGGVGENAWQIREKVIQPFGWAGISLDPEANRATVGIDGRISSGSSKTDIRVLCTDEAELMVVEALQVIRGT